MEGPVRRPGCTICNRVADTGTESGRWITRPIRSGIDRRRPHACATQPPSEEGAREQRRNPAHRVESIPLPEGAGPDRHRREEHQTWGDLGYGVQCVWPPGLGCGDARRGSIQFHGARETSDSRRNHDGILSRLFAVNGRDSAGVGIWHRVASSQSDLELLSWASHSKCDFVPCWTWIG